ncbi:SNF2-related protein [Nakamurella sp.]|uniref:SNF2-related protein n=1 Tax=Nakamurella sp. TaxID=1869182 RepID=UPI003B3A20CF
MAWHVGDVVLGRARSVLARGGVLTCTQTRPGELQATVSGTRPWPYQVGVSYVLAGDRVGAFEGDCDCPVELDCKHAVAALLHHLAGASRPTAGRGLVVVGPDGADDLDGADEPAAGWERSLTRLLGASCKPRAERDRVHTMLALQVAVTRTRTAGPFGSAGVRIRPIQFNARHRWVSTGVSWRDLRYGYYTAQHRPEQLETLRGLADLELRRHPQQALAAWISLDGPGGAQLWDALADAQQAGIELLLDGQHTPIELSTDSAELALDVARAGAFRVTPVLRLGERVLDPAVTALIGRPVHGLLLGPGDPGGAAGPALLLARLRRPLTADLAGLLDGGTIEIPPADEDRFLGEFLPGLRRRIGVLSTDGSAVLPEPVPPRPVLTLTREPEHRLSLHWQWQEESGRRRELDDRAGLPAEDRAAMRRMIAAVVATGALPDAALAAGPDGPAPHPRFLLTGADCVRFMTGGWPVLAQLPDLIAELDGPDAALRYRPATGDAELDLAAIDESGVGSDGSGVGSAGSGVGSAGAADADGRDWFGFAVRVTVDGEHVPFGLIFRALAADEPMLILPSGTYLDLTGPGERWARLRDLIEESRAMDDTPADELRVGRYTASRWADLEDTGLLGDRAARWRDRIRRLGPPAQAPAPAPPAGLHADLRDYQRAGLDWLRARFDRGLGGVLADDMGLGKTLQMLGLVAHAREADPAGPPVLVVAPTSVVGNWVAEAARFTPGLRVATVTRSGARRGGSLAETVAGADLVVTSYQLFRLDAADFAEQRWAALILDEAQFVKNTQSKGFRCARDFPAPVTFAVTGTPLENNLTEFWALLALSAPGLFPDLRRFTEYYRVPIERGGAPERLAQLHRRAAPFLLRRTKEQVAPELPPKLEQVIELDLSPRHQQLYQRYLQRERQKVLGLLAGDGSVQDNRFQILKSLTLLRQLSLDPSLVDPAHADVPSSKLEVAIDRIAEIVESGHRVLVFSQFTRFLDRTADRLDALALPHCRLDGRTRDRGAVVEAFRSGAAPVFLISLKAGGFGLNLTEADYCILLDPWWNPAAEAQAVDRAHRIGQTKRVIVHRYVARGTIEEKVMALKAGKARLFDEVVGPAGRAAPGSVGPEAGAERSAGPAGLTAAEIRDLLA